MTGCRIIAITVVSFFLLLPMFATAAALTTREQGIAVGDQQVETVTTNAIFEPVQPTRGFQHTVAGGALMLCILGAAFFAMTRYNVPLPLAMSVVACLFLALQFGESPINPVKLRPSSEAALVHGFKHYAPIAILFTAVAIPAHMIERSNGFRWIAAFLALRLARLRIRNPRLTMPVLVFMMLVFTYVSAALLHNVTSILIMTPIIIRLCDSFKIPSRWLLCGALIASNLGGFSTKWGDTPNIVEAGVWKLSAVDFFVEVLPANLLVLTVLCLVVLRLTQRQVARMPAKERGSVTVNGQTFSDAIVAADWRKVLRDLTVDRYLLVVGVGVLTGFILLHVLFDDQKFVIGALAIVLAVALERSEHRFATLKSLGFDVYLAFAAIFVLAECVGNSWIGDELQGLIETTKGETWAICLTGYLGTTFTEAASWATLASGKIYDSGAISHSAAWALGGGICAGSSSLVTAASAGVILAEESSRFKEAHAITFRSYLPFGIGFSLFMLVFYSVYFSVFHY